MLDQFTFTLARYKQRIDAALDAALPTTDDAASRLFDAMHYSVQNGGKRIRPILVYATAELFGDIGNDHDRVATAIEFIHAYSLIHDDLPAMDDDDLRRGKPTCHIAYDEATAILAGDGLQSLAFEQLASIDADPAITVQLVRLLAFSAGCGGMVTGQAIDLFAVNQLLTLEQLQHMHQLKTGALIQSSVQMSAMLAGLQSGDTEMQALIKYSRAIGLAFQVQDDILDVVSATNELGKPQGSDAENNKPTYTSLLGLEGAKQKLAELHATAIDALTPFGERAATLEHIANYIVERRN